MTDMAEQKLREYARLSVGLESIDGILYDLDQALSGA